MAPTGTARRKAKRPSLSLESTLAVVLSHPLRVRCLVALSVRSACPAELARAFTLDSSKLITYHLRKLEEIGVVEVIDEREVKGNTERFYRATERPIIHEEEWTKLTVEQRNNFDRYILERHFSEVALAFDDGVWGKRLNKWLVRNPMTLDEEGFAELAEAHEEQYSREIEIQARSLERMRARRTRGEDPGEISVRSTNMFYEAASGSSELDGLPD